MKRYIQNFDHLAVTKERTDLLTIIESAYEAIDTRKIIDDNLKIKEDSLIIADQVFDLKKFDRIFVFGFGKTSSVAVEEIEKVLGDKINGGIVLDKKINENHKYVKAYVCAHPLPKEQNVVASKEVVKLAESLGERDLALVVVSGGGSAMISYPESEYKQGAILYNEFLKSGGNITELNTLRKHLSLIKGGGLAKLLYPATVASLIFCDVPGDHFDQVASGPTYKDSSSIPDTKEIIKKYNLTNKYTFIETPKEDKYFEKVHNIPLVTNTHALIGMEKKGIELGYNVYNAGAQLYQNPEVIIDLFLSQAKPHSIVIGAGEPSIIVKGKGNTGGRCEHLTINALEKIGDDDLMSSFASDGIDNLSISAGAIADSTTKEKAAGKNLSISKNIENNTADEFFKETGDQIITGETGSNVSDVMILLRK